MHFRQGVRGIFGSMASLTRDVRTGLASRWLAGAAPEPSGAAFITKLCRGGWKSDQR